MVMELLGKNIQDLFLELDCKFSLKTICILTDQIVLSQLTFRYKESNICTTELSFTET